MVQRRACLINTIQIDAGGATAAWNRYTANEAQNGWVGKWREGTYLVGIVTSAAASVAYNFCQSRSRSLRSLGPTPTHAVAILVSHRGLRAGGPHISVGRVVLYWTGTRKALDGAYRVRGRGNWRTVRVRSCMDWDRADGPGICWSSSYAPVRSRGLDT